MVGEVDVSPDPQPIEIVRNRWGISVGGGRIAAVRRASAIILRLTPHFACKCVFSI